MRQLKSISIYVNIVGEKLRNMQQFKSSIEINELSPNLWISNDWEYRYAYVGPTPLQWLCEVAEHFFQNYCLKSIQKYERISLTNNNVDSSCTCMWAKHELEIKTLKKTPQTCISNRPFQILAISSLS
jgi:hypothetical protein